MRVWKLATIGAVMFGILGGLAACGGKDDPPPAASQPAPAPLPAGTVGTAGGTVTGPNASQVVIPAGALAQNTVIEIAAAPTGAPPLPAGVTAAGAILAFTPHGTAFATPATVTVPFDPALVPTGTQPLLYKTDAQSNWQPVTGAQVSGATMTAAVGGFSFFVVTLPPVELVQLDRAWRFETISRDAARTELELDGSVTPVALAEYQDIGLLRFSQQLARVTVFSSATGNSYSASADAPAEEPVGPGPVVGSHSTLWNTQIFRKDADNATLRARITGLRLHGADYDPRNAGLPGWKIWSQAEISYTAHAYDFRRGITRDLLKRESGVVLSGHNRTWNYYPYTLSGSPLFDDTNIEFWQDVNGINGDGAEVVLGRDIIVDIPIESLAVGEHVLIQARVDVEAIDLSQTESTATAYLRDPQDVGGEFLYTGLERVSAPRAPLLEVADGPADACPGPARPEAGTLQFESAGLAINEAGGIGSMVTVTRTGGTSGDVSALVSTAHGSASAADYTTVSRVVRFDDGDGGRRMLFVPITPDALEEEDETVQLTLSDARGCAALGDLTAATITILDDDRPAPAPPTYVVGGTVSGLIGTGLEIEELRSHQLLTPSNGAFQFPLGFTQNAAYEVRVNVQPTNPVQTCSVTNAGGTVAGQDVTNIEVTCAAPAASGGLDPAFGDNGRVVINGAGAATAVALQADGKILVTYPGAQLLRLNADGTLDATFGTGGIVAVDFSDDRSERALAVAVQADQKIVVAGYTSVDRRQNMGAARLNADGTPDLAFGTQGRVAIPVVTDLVTAERTISGDGDEANGILIQPDGKIVLTGSAVMIVREGGTSNAFGFAAAVRLNADGSLDSTFQGNGRATHGFGPDEVAFGYASALQPDGKIIVGGSVSSRSGDPDLALVRFNTDGTADDSFGNEGDYTRVDVAGGADTIQGLVLAPNGHLWVAAQYHSPAASARRFGLLEIRGDGFRQSTGSPPSSMIHDADDFVRDIELLPDGKMLLAGAFASSTVNDYAVARMNADGSADTSFGTNGVVTVDFFDARDFGRGMVVQPDGKAIVVGGSWSGTQDVLTVIRLQN
jgi:uncharacterized delta-60 repeat protein